MTQGLGEPVRWEGISLDSIRKALADGHSATMHEVADVLARIQPLIEAAEAAVRGGLDGVLEHASGAAAETWAREIATLLVFVQELSGALPGLATATTTVAQGFDQVLAKVDNAVRPESAPPRFHTQDDTLSWLDWPAHEDYEERARGDAEDIRSALARYQTTTTAALRAIPPLPPKLAGRPGPGSPVIRPMSGSSPAGRQLDSIAEPPTEPMHSNPSPFWRQAGPSQTEFGPVGHAAEDEARAQAKMTSPIETPDTTPRRPHLARSWEAPWTPVRPDPGTGNPFFDPDPPIIGPVIGE